MNRDKYIKLMAFIKGRHKTLRGKVHPGIQKWLLLGSRVAALGVALVLLLIFFVSVTLPDVTNVENLIPDQSSTIYDRDGNALYRIFGEENRKTVSLEDISQWVPMATMAIEDDQFYEHSGIDLPAIIKSICYEVRVCSQPRGGSTITQQFVKNAFLSPERTYSRKLREILLALKLERKFTKDQIIEMYLNRINYGSNMHGVELAANTFFDKPAKDLTIAEAAILASIPKAPAYYSPYGSHIYPIIDLSEAEIIKRGIASEQDLIDYDPSVIAKGLIGKTYTFGAELDDEGNVIKPGIDIYIQGRVDFVLGRMEALGYITPDQHKEALQEAIIKEFKPYKENIIAPHFVLWVREQLEAKYGMEQLQRGGLRIHTTLNSDMQKAAEEAVAKYAERNETNFKVTNASLVAADPQTGEILAMVGSRDYWNDEIDGKVNVALRPRLPGSSFKPIAYAAAFLQGYAPATVVYDVLTNFGKVYEPENFDGEFMGPISLRNALAFSRNVPAVKAGYLAGIPNVLDLARKMGIQLNQPDDWYGLSLALGAGEARPLDMVLAYSIFANGGHKVDPVTILKIEDKNGNILEEYEAPKKRDLVLDPQAAYLINDVLSDAQARPEGFWRDRLTIPGQINAAKTGTSNKKKNDVNYPFDLWTIGYTTRLAAGVWAGNANGDAASLKASGLDAAGPIWKEFMVASTKDMPREAFKKPDGIKYVQVSKRSGKLPSENTPPDEIITEVFASFNVPKEIDHSYIEVEIDKVSGKLATEYTPAEAREKKAFFTHHSIRPEDPIWEDPVRKWAEENGQDEEPPTEYDDVHTPETNGDKPEIVIMSPRAMATVTPPTVGVVVDVTSKTGIEKVDYFWDDELVATSTQPPFKGTVRVPSDAKDGSKHSIKAVVYDKLFRTNQSSIEVRIGADEAPPVVTFEYPAAGASLAANSVVAVQVDAVDANGDVARVELSLDGAPLVTLRQPPFVYTLKVPNALGEHSLEAVAYDYAGNSAKATMNFTSAPSDSDLGGLSRILEPSRNASFAEGGRVLIKIYLEADAQSGLKEAVLTAKRDDQTITIGRLTSDDLPLGPTSVFLWDQPTAGTYELQLKVDLGDGRLRFSEKVPVLIR